MNEAQAVIPKAFRTKFGMPITIGLPNHRNAVYIVYNWYNKI